MLKKGETKIAKCFIFGQKELYKYVCVCTLKLMIIYLKHREVKQMYHHVMCGLTVWDHSLFMIQGRGDLGLGKSL